LLHTLNKFAEHIYCSVLFETTITLFKLLRTFPVNQTYINLCESWPGLSGATQQRRTDGCLFLQILQNVLKHSSLESEVTKKTAISAHFSTPTNQLAFHCQGQTILVTLVTKILSVACITTSGLKFGTRGRGSEEGARVNTRNYFVA